MRMLLVGNVRSVDVVNIMIKRTSTVFAWRIKYDM